MKREIRSMKLRELRAEKAEDGRQYLVGYAANYGVLSEDLGGWRERIMPGAFRRAIVEKHDVRHLKNHDANLVLGRTKSGTTELLEDSVGLHFRTLMPNTSYAKDLLESVERGDVDEGSFGFMVDASQQKWLEERDANGARLLVRELHDMALSDIATVTFPAYPGTKVGIDSRALFPEGAPQEIRSHVAGSSAGVETRQEAFLVEQRQRASERGRCCVIGPAPPRFRAAVQPDSVLEILMYEEIGYDFWTDGGITAKSVKQQLDAAGEFSSIRLRINSPGGDAFEGAAIYNLLRAQGKPIECCIDGVAASAASVIAMCGDTITMGQAAMMMIHDAWSICIGNASEMRQMAEVLDKICNSLAETYVFRTGKSLDDVRALMEAETWMSAEECVASGFATRLAPVDPDKEEEEEEAEEEQMALARSFRSLSRYKRLPAALHPEDEEVERMRLKVRAALLA